jgi:hypothetical protein
MTEPVQDPNAIALAQANDQINQLNARNQSIAQHASDMTQAKLELHAMVITLENRVRYLAQELEVKVAELLHLKKANVDPTEPPATPAAPDAQPPTIIPPTTVDPTDDSVSDNGNPDETDIPA